MGAAAAERPQIVSSRAGKIWRAVKIALFLAFIAVLGVGGGFSYTVYNNLGGYHGIKGLYDTLKDPGKKAFGDRTRMNILCLGVDYNHDEKGIQYTKYARTDTVFVVGIDRKGQNLSILSIPRDMRVAIPGHGYDKINAAFTFAANGARDLTVKTVENFLGIHVDHVIVIKPYAAEHLVDALGGVTLSVEKKMDYDDNWGSLHIHLKKGVQHLNGRQAVGYIRFRHDEEGDRGRIRRQQQLVNAMLTQLPRIETLTHIQEVKAAIQKDIQTTLSYDQLVDIGVLYKGFDRRKMRTGRVEGKDALIDGAYFMVADESQKQNVVAQLLGHDDARSRSAQVRVEVLNGSLVDGAASNFARLLKQEGFCIVRVGNADKVPNTQLVDRLNDPHATGTVQKLVASRGMGPVAVLRGESKPRSDADITIVLGEDYRAY